MPESGRLGAGVGNVHFSGGVPVQGLPLGGSQINDGDLVYLQAGKFATVGNGASGASGFGASFAGVANGATPTYGLYGDPETPEIRVLVGGKVKLVNCANLTYVLGQPLYFAAGSNQVTNVANGSAFARVISPPGNSFGADYYGGSVTTVYAEIIPVAWGASSPSFA